MSESTGYRVCTRCVMDTSDPDITFDAQGVCNHCRAHDAWAARQPAPAEAERQLEQTVETIRRHGKGREHDCVMGVSGGVDSSYVAYLASQYGLRPLVIHFDNGWDSELAVANIENLLGAFGYDFSTNVIDWQEFRDLQRAFLKAGVVDVELLTDHAITASMYRLAWKRGIRYVLSGTNAATEFVMPRAWTWYKFDIRNIRAIHARFGERKLARYPVMGPLALAASEALGRVKSFSPLDLAGYVKDDAKALLAERFGWRDYGGKHYESIFTKFYQAYILPEKFGIDKRRPHQSSLILSGQTTREHALAELEKPLYEPRELERDREYVLKKLGFGGEEFDAIMAASPVPHAAYANSERLYKFLVSVRRMLPGGGK